MSVETYQFINHHPGTTRLRDGTIIDGGRTSEMWRKAFEGHKRSAHRGEFKESCAACKELSARVRA